jgi:hypothetical protein
MYFLCREMGYDGVVLESWSRWAAYGILRDPSMRNLVSICYVLFNVEILFTQKR